MTIEKIGIFKKKSYSQYNALHYFRMGLEKALKAQGIEVSSIDQSEMSRFEFLQSMYVNPPDLTLALNGLIPVDGRFLCDEIQVPHVAWLVDSAHWFHEMASGLLNILISPDAYSADLFKKWGAKRSYFLPHAFDATDRTSPGGERDLPIVFCGSLMDPIEIEETWKNSLPLSLAKDLVSAGHEVIHSRSLPYQQAFDQLFSHHVAYLQTLPPEKLLALIQSLDTYIRGKDRIEILKALSGLPVHIYGNSLSNRGWGDFLDLEKGSYYIHEALDFAEAVQVMKSAQIVLNSSPMFKSGAHERIFYGLGLGSCVLTNDTSWVHSHFKNGSELLVYNLHEKKEISDKIRALLERPEELEGIAWRGQEKVMRLHTWDVRSKELLEIVENELKTIWSDS